VKSGDTLSAIAAANGVTTAALIAANNISDANTITVGQTLRIPAASASTPAASTSSSASASSSSSAGGSGQSYTVKSGDTACQIAANFKVSIGDLASANGTSASGLDTIQVGQTLKIPAPSSGGGGC
jgi:peptidoglycan DL-endopeptidase LytF